MTRALLAVIVTAATASAAPSRFPVRPVSVELGVRVVGTTAQLRKALRVDADHGVLVMEVRSGGPADRAGLRAADVVTAVDGKAVASTSDVLDALEGKHPGDDVAVDYVRSGAAATAPVKLARAEPPRMRMGQWSFPIPGGRSPEDAERELRSFRDRIERELRDLDRRLRNRGEDPDTDRTAL
jgi:C-terminal processing protease CtpA/Prc